MNAFRHYREGAVRVKLRGFSPERFFNLCSQGGVEIWGVSCKGGEYEFFTTVKGFFSCAPFVRKSGVRLTILEKTGLPFFLYKNRSRKLWAAGFLGFFLILFLLSLFIWDIELQGNFHHSDSELLHFLQREGIACGILKRNIDCEKLEGELRSTYSDVTWVSARVEGTRLYVHIKENDVVLTVPERDDTPCDLVADADGTIVSMVVRSGIPAVKPGDEVKKGQVLVSGRIPITDDSGQVVTEHQVKADADIVGRRKRREETEISFWHEKKTMTGRKRKGIFFRAFGKTISFLPPDFEDRDWRYTSETWQAHVTDTFYLPFFCGSILSEEYVSCQARYTKEELSQMAEEYRRQTEGKLIEKGVHIIENNVTILDNGSVCRFRLDMTVEEPFGNPAPVSDETERAEISS